MFSGVTHAERVQQIWLNLWSVIFGTHFVCECSLPIASCYCSCCCGSTVPPPSSSSTLLLAVTDCRRHRFPTTLIRNCDSGREQHIKRFRRQLWSRALFISFVANIAIGSRSIAWNYLVWGFLCCVLCILCWCTSYRSLSIKHPEWFSFDINWIAHTFLSTRPPVLIKRYEEVII